MTAIRYRRYNRIDHDEFGQLTGAAYRSDGFGSVEDNQDIRLDHNHFVRAAGLRTPLDSPWHAL